MFEFMVIFLKEFFEGKKKKKAFSLLEIMVVITIMAMIMGAVSVGVMRYLDTSQKKQAEMDINTISNALDLYKTEYGTYPRGDSGLRELAEKDVLKGGKVPKDPWGNEYIYIYPGSRGKSYDLYSFGPDGQEGGGDDISNWDDSGEDY